jgi:hypothetical protein
VAEFHLVKLGWKAAVDGVKLDIFCEQRVAVGLLLRDPLHASLAGFIATFAFPIWDLPLDSADRDRLFGWGAYRLAVIQSREAHSNPAQ